MNRKKIYGALAGAAVGEALGCAVTTWTTDMIRAEYGEYLTEIHQAPSDTKMKGLYPAGHSADAVSYAWMLLECFVKKNGDMTEFDAGETLLAWAEDPQKLALAGSVTREGYGRLAGIDTGYRYPFLTYDHHKISNEAAARAFVPALFYPGEWEQACEKAVMVYKNIYDNMVSLSAAGAMAAAVSQALADDATYQDILSAAVEGARRGYDIADSYRIQPAATALVSRRIELAIETGMRYKGNFDEALVRLEELIGNSNAANESVPAVFGCLAACGDDPSAFLTMAVNMGNDSDMMGAMAGVLAGAMHPDFLNPQDIRLVASVNGYDFEKMSDAVLSCIQNRI